VSRTGGGGTSDRYPRLRLVIGHLGLPAFLDLRLEVGVDRIMFSADHPYASMEEARAFLDRLPVSDVDRERIANGDTERLLRL